MTRASQEQASAAERSVADERAGTRKSTDEPERAMWCESAVGRERAERLRDRRVTNWSGVTDPAAKPGPCAALKEGTDNGGGDGDDDFCGASTKLANQGPSNVEPIIAEIV